MSRSTPRNALMNCRRGATVPPHQKVCCSGKDTPVEDSVTVAMLAAHTAAEAGHQQGGAKAASNADHRAPLVASRQEGRHRRGRGATRNALAMRVHRSEAQLSPTCLQAGRHSRPRFRPPSTA